jgi:hypothetical protein
MIGVFRRMNSESIHGGSVIDRKEGWKALRLFSLMSTTFIDEFDSNSEIYSLNSSAS